MDYSYNPFSGWSQVGQRSSSIFWDNNGYTPSTFGALPYAHPPPPPDLVTFYITSFNPDILNSTVIGPNQQRYLRIVTDPQNPAYTIFQNPQGRSIALVEWQSERPLLEIRGVMSKGLIRDWLRLTSDQRARTMQYQGREFTWAPQDKYIAVSARSNPVLLARISRGFGTITLDLTNRALQHDLLDACIIASVILQCGRSID
ncbi:hypothetical protein D9757_004194 [Collybiopsis confluens]|uniref:DUF6593 domain-containing protein n=1 Tax=Collybiopsis confluens TaxID=2823264 RepID=A0A8H5MD27_9AGAR|nr:hypothetical protein D9757_004194 [Collybiopsis confluens]